MSRVLLALCQERDVYAHASAQLREKKANDETQLAHEYAHGETIFFFLFSSADGAR